MTCPNGPFTRPTDTTVASIRTPTNRPFSLPRYPTDLDGTVSAACRNRRLIDPRVRCGVGAEEGGAEWFIDYANCVV